MIVEFNYNPILEDFNKNRTLKIPAIMKILENAGTKHTDAVGDNILDSSNKGLTWILTDWYVEIKSCPTYGDKILSKTWSQFTTTTFGCARDFELYANEKLAAIASTRWVLLDLKTERPTKIDREWFTIYQSEDKSVFDNPRLPKTETVTEYLSEKAEFIYKVSRTRIETTEEGLTVYMEVIVNYGCDIVKCLTDFKKKTKREIENLTAMNVESIEIVAKGIQLPEEEEK